MVERTVWVGEYGKYFLLALIFLGGLVVLDDNNNNTFYWKLEKITNYIISHPQIAYKLIETGEAEEILQVQDLYINGLNNSEDITTQ